jgi:hypothetical protein
MARDRNRFPKQRNRFGTFRLVRVTASLPMVESADFAACGQSSEGFF